MSEGSSLADVMARLDALDRVLGLELRALSAEVRAFRAEATAELAALRQQVVDLDHGLRDLWTEHLAHSHPDEGTGA